MGWSLLLTINVSNESDLGIDWLIIEPYESEPLGAMVERSLNLDVVQ